MPAVLTLILGKTEEKELFTVWPDIIGGKEGVGSLPKATATKGLRKFDVEHKGKTIYTYSVLL